MKNKARINKSKNLKSGNHSPHKEEKKILNSEKNETKSKLKVPFVYTENKNLSEDEIMGINEPGTKTQEMTFKCSEEIRGNNTHIPINSLINNIEEERDKDDQVEDFNINRYATNFKNRK